jgi:hypothetical protein
MTARNKNTGRRRKKSEMNEREVAEKLNEKTLAVLGRSCSYWSSLCEPIFLVYVIHYLTIRLFSKRSEMSNKVLRSVALSSTGGEF